MKTCTMDAEKVGVELWNNVDGIANFRNSEIFNLLVVTDSNDPVLAGNEHSHIDIIIKTF